MLKGIPSILSPELLKVLMEMGHGDEIVIGDGNFPGQSHGKQCLRCDGHGTAELLEAILKLFPLDTYEAPVYLMAKVPGDPVETPSTAASSRPTPMPRCKRSSALRSMSVPKRPTPS